MCSHTHLRASTARLRVLCAHAVCAGSLARRTELRYANQLLTKIIRNGRSGEAERAGESASALRALSRRLKARLYAPDAPGYQRLVKGSARAPRPVRAARKAR